MRVTYHETMTEAWHYKVEEIMFSPPEDLVFAGITGVIYDHAIHCRSMVFDFDVGRDLWLTKDRFPRLQRDYLERGTITPFLESCVDAHTGKRAKAGVTTGLLCKEPVWGGKRLHRWGNCMMGLTFRGGAGQPTVSLHSRASVITELGAMDMGLAWVIGREIAEAIGEKQEDLAFNWHLDQMQASGFKNVPYVMSQDMYEIFDLERYPTRRYPILNSTRKSIGYMQRDLDMGRSLEWYKYGPRKRMAKRYRMNVAGDPLPSLPLARLQLLEEMR